MCAAQLRLWLEGAMQKNLEIYRIRPASRTAYATADGMKRARLRPKRGSEPHNGTFKMQVSHKPDHLVHFYHTEILGLAAAVSINFGSLIVDSSSFDVDNFALNNLLVHCYRSWHPHIASEVNLGMVDLGIEDDTLACEEMNNLAYHQPCSPF
ncbi:hypothetical protein HAX54_041213 [Datura stramonium]|uniref:Uncharacterized protein n=1 Tax=Datura stramonium TaxID=4076 RepID=A0ABS8VQU1_DATST|nr:hypothetical protein [Datura stramonium]